MSSSKRTRLHRMAGALFAAVLALTVVTTPAAWAIESVPAMGSRLEAQSLVPIGRTAGIKMYAGGVIVTELSDVQTSSGTVCPAKAAGLQPGDLITRVDGVTVTTADGLVNAINAKLEAVELTVKRGTQQRTCRLTPAVESGSGRRKIGAFVRDSLAGIGTITFYDPESGVFGALGHGISEGETGILMPLASGSLIASTVTGVQRGERGTPGSLIGSFDLSSDAGTLHGNLDTGLFGVLRKEELYPELLSAAPIPVGTAAEVQPGAAVILANVSGDQVQAYDIEIVRILSRDSATKNLYLRVTDPALLDATGGIVQGMSGSPILQNGKLIGAVTHVLVSDPTCGYGILIEKMLNSAGSDAFSSAA